MRAGSTGGITGAASESTEISSATRSSGVSSRAPMVWLSPPDGVRAVQLLVHEQPGELVRKRQPGQAPRALGRPQHDDREGVGAADHERYVPAIHLPARRPVGELP